MPLTSTLKKITHKLFSISVYLFIFLIPWQTRLILNTGMLGDAVWEYGTRSLYATDILFILIVLLWIIDHNRKENKEHKKSPVLFLAVLLVIIALLSITWSSNTTITGYMILKLIEGVMIVFILADKKIKITTALWVIFLAGIVQSVFAYGQFMMQYIPASKWLGLSEHAPQIPGDIVVETITERWLRAYGSFPHPNMLGGFLLLALFAGAGLAVSHKRKQRIVAFAGSLIIAFGIFITFSRSAWFALIVGMVLLGVASYHHSQRFTTWAWIGSILILFITQTALAPDLVFSRWEQQVRLEQQSTESRQLYVEQAKQLLKKDNWIFGVGYGNYTYSIYKHIDNSHPGWAYQPVHFTPMLVLAELGVFGLITYALLFLTIFASVLRHITKNEYHTGIQHHQFLVLALLGTLLFIIGFFDHYFWTLHSGIMMFWMVIGLWHKMWLEAETDSKKI